MTNTTYIWLRQCLVHANVLPYHGFLDLRGTPCLEERTGPQSACQLGKCHPTDICSVKPSENLMVIGYDYMITAFEKMNNLQLVFMVFYHLRVGYRAGTGHSLPRCARGPQPSVPSPLPFRLSSECLWS